MLLQEIVIVLVPSLMKQELVDFIGYTQFREASPAE